MESPDVAPQPPHGFVDVASEASFQRVIISGGALHTDESLEACALLARCLKLRSVHCFKKPAYYWGALRPRDFPQSRRPLPFDGVTTDAQASQAHFSSPDGVPACPPPHPALHHDDTLADIAAGGAPSSERRRRNLPHWAPFDPLNSEAAPNLFSAIVDGIMHVFDADAVGCVDSTPVSPLSRESALFVCSTWDAFVRDLRELVRVIHLPFVNTFAHRRLDLLEARFQLHAKLNVDRECATEAEEWLPAHPPMC